jgi:hypothetical protein
MKITLSLKETETLLAWKKSSKVLLPNEEMLIAILKKHAGGGIELSDNQIVILSAWAESAVDGNFGSGAIANIEEKKIYDKIREAYTAISSDGNEIENLNTVKIPIPQKGKSLSGNSRFTKVVVIGLMLFVVILVVSRSLTHSCGEKCIHGKTAHGTHDWKVEYIARDVSIKTTEN